MKTTTSKTVSLLSRFLSTKSLPPHKTSLSPLMELCTRRGFVYPGSTIYGGMASTFDYGPLGSQLKKNIADAWWKDFVELRPECVGLDTPIIIHPEVWHASGHVEEFTDPLIQCNTCNQRTRADKLLEDKYGVSPEAVAGCIKDEGMVGLGNELSRVNAECPACNSTDLGKPRNFNLLFETNVGTSPNIETPTPTPPTPTPPPPTSSPSATKSINTLPNETNQAYLRPETAQGAYINFANVINSTRKKLPMGIGQIGKAFRNEISPGKYSKRRSSSCNYC